MSFLNVYYDCSDIYEKIDCLMLALCNIVGFFKLSMFHIYAENLTRNYSSAIDDYLAVHTEEKRLIMRQHAFLGRIIFYCVVIFGFITSFGLIVTPIMASENMQVNVSLSKYASKYPIPSTCTLGYLQIISTLYFIIFVVQSALIIIASFAYVGNKIKIILCNIDIFCMLMLIYVPCFLFFFNIKKSNYYKYRGCNSNDLDLDIYYRGHPSESNVLEILVVAHCL